MNKGTLLLITVVLLISCNQSEPGAENNTALVSRYFDHFNRHNWDSMAAMYADTAVFKDPSLGTGMVKQTQKQVADKYASLQKLFPDVRDSVLHVYPSGAEQVIVEFISKGTSPDGSKFELPICTIFTFKQGKITGDYTYYDNFEGPK